MLRAPRAWNPERVTLEELYRDHFGFVCRVAGQRCGLMFDAEDVAQEVFLVVARRLPTFDAAATSPTSWLYGITRNLVRRLRRNQRLREAKHARIASTQPLGYEPLDRAELVEATRVASEILAKLAPKKREVFILAELESYECADIGALVGAKEETVWSRLHYARREFRSRLARYSVCNTAGA